MFYKSGYVIGYVVVITLKYTKNPPIVIKKRQISFGLTKVVKI